MVSSNDPPEASVMVSSFSLVSTLWVVQQHCLNVLKHLYAEVTTVPKRFGNRNIGATPMSMRSWLLRQWRHEHRREAHL